MVNNLLFMYFIILSAVACFRKKLNILYDNVYLLSILGRTQTSRIWHQLAKLGELQEWEGQIGEPHKVYKDKKDKRKVLTDFL